MSAPYEILDIVPHSGDMSLLDSLVSYNDESLCAELTLANTSCFATESGVPAWVGIEYMAQAIAAHAGALARDRGDEVSIGLLVGTRKYACNKPLFPLGSILTVNVHREILGDNGLASYRCGITSEDIKATANINVFQPDDIEHYLSNKS